MDLATNFLELLKSTPGFIYGFVAVFIGFVCGILVSRLRRKSVRITRLESLEEQFVRLDEELERLVEVAGRVWAKAYPGSSANGDTSQPKSYRTPSQSWIKRLYRKTLGKAIKKITKRKKRKAADATSHLADSVVRLKSQTDKISLAESQLPARSQELPTILRPNEVSERIEGVDSVHGRDLNGAVSLARDRGEAVDNRTTETPEDRFQRSGRHPSNIQDELLGIYNHAVNDTFAREEFRERYQPIRLGTVNAVERRQNPTADIKAEFRETTDGDFFAVPSSGATTFRVVPRLGLTVGAVSYNAGALGEMFENPNYDPAQSYSRYRVLKPAIFRRDGEKWELVEPGRLDLGAPD